MHLTAKGWLGLALFQVAFGFAVFALTRAHYTAGPPASVATAPTSEWQPLVTALERAPATAALDDPAALAREADAAFTERRYERAAEIYAQLLALDAHNVDIYNNLGITLHYLGRSEEALERLAEGTRIDPTHQRAWLTTGFVHAALGHTVEARSALTKAVELGADERVRDSARQMLAKLE